MAAVSVMSYLNIHGVNCGYFVCYMAIVCACTNCRCVLHQATLSVCFVPVYFQCITRNDCSSVKLDTSSGTCQLIDSAIFACDDTALGVYHKVTLSLCSMYYLHTFAYMYSICMRKHVCSITLKHVEVYVQTGHIQHLQELVRVQVKSSSCSNGGTPVSDYLCDCPSGWSGPFCDYGKTCC